MATPSTMTSMLVSRTSVLNSDSTASYTFKLKQVPNLPAGSRLTVTFPSVLVIGTPLSCLSLTSVVLNCSQTSNSILVQLTATASPGV